MLALMCIFTINSRTSLASSLDADALAELIPLAALTGVLFMIVIYTFDWTCLPLMSGDLKGLIIGRKEDGSREDYAGRRRRRTTLHPERFEHRVFTPRRASPLARSLEFRTVRAR